MEFNQDNFNILLKQNERMRKTLQGIIDGCVHPETAYRAVMIDLKPIKNALNYSGKVT